MCVRVQWGGGGTVEPPVRTIVRFQRSSRDCCGGAKRSRLAMAAEKTDENVSIAWSRQMYDHEKV